MSRQLPPLPALRAFESAARLGGFTASARELNLTPGAISHHVRRLEASLGVALFDRNARGVALTEAGRRYARTVGGLFNEIGEATAALAQSEPARAVRIRCQLSVGAKWLPPILAEVNRLYPEIQLDVRTQPHSADPLAEGDDMAIYYSRGPSIGVVRDPLIGGEIVAVCAPSYIAARDLPLSPEQIARENLIHLKPADLGWVEYDWPQWFEAAGVDAPARLAGLTVNLMHTAIETCVAGAGIALVNTAFARRELAEGQLLRCARRAVQAPHAFHLLTRQGALARSEVSLVRERLLAHRSAA